MDNFLPVGTIIKAKKYEKNLMIIGNFVKKDDKVYEYGCVIYPYGLLLDIENIALNNDDIEKIIFLGNVNY